MSEPNQTRQTTGPAGGREFAMAKPDHGEAGMTGTWRINRPVLTNPATCLAVKAGKITCELCWVYCPDACVSRGIGPEFNLDYCKGCGICAQVCPTGSITMVAEASTDESPSQLGGQP